MDFWAIRANCTANRAFMLLRNPISERPILSANLKNVIVHHFPDFEIKLPKKNARSFVVRATGNKNSDDSKSNSSSSSSGKDDHSFPDDNSLKGSNPSSESKNAKNNDAQKSNHKTLDWREFRASLYRQEQTAIPVSDTNTQDGTSLGFKLLPPKWAHPISAPENGCLLVATEKLDGVRTFERTVILLLRSGTRHPQEGPFGVVLNRALGKKMKHMKPSNLDLATTFADCYLHFGGPLEASMFLLRGGKSEIHRFEEVLPGVSFGARNSLEEAAALVKKGALKPQDFRFFFGYAGWQLDQLREEIESNFWYVAACSADLIFSGSQISSSESLWEETLQLMGGHYSEVSRKPKRDS